MGVRSAGWGTLLSCLLGSRDSSGVRYFCRTPSGVGCSGTTWLSLRMLMVLFFIVRKRSLWKMSRSQIFYWKQIHQHWLLKNRCSDCLICLGYECCSTRITCLDLACKITNVVNPGIREFKKTMMATVTGTSLNKRFNEQNNGYACVF